MGNLVLLGIILFLSWGAHRLRIHALLHPEGRAARIDHLLFLHPFGFRTDTALMSRRDLFVSGGRALLYAAGALGLLALAFWAGSAGGQDLAERPSLLIVIIASFFFFVLFSLSAAILLIKGALTHPSGC